jgi:hypothetical protein
MFCDRTLGDFFSLWFETRLPHCNRGAQVSRVFRYGAGGKMLYSTVGAAECFHAFASEQNKLNSQCILTHCRKRIEKASI